jgi:hypothetical protein
LLAARGGGALALDLAASAGRVGVRSGVMRRVLGLLAAVILCIIAGAPAQAGLRVSVDIAAQRMTVKTSDGEVHRWAVSSGRQGFRSPNGVYRPTRLERRWHSRKYGGAMPHSVFFRGGYAIHGTDALGALGRPASHGCIRLHPAHAAKLFALVRKHGAARTTIALSGAAPDGPATFAKASGKADKTGKTGKLAAAGAKAEAAPAAKRDAPGWDTARGRLLLKPSLPPGAIGYQPAGPPRGSR